VGEHVTVVLPLEDGVALNAALGLKEAAGLGVVVTLLVVVALRVADDEIEADTLELALSVAVEEMLGNWEAVVVDEAVAAADRTTYKHGNRPVEGGSQTTVNKATCASLPRQTARATQHTYPLV